MKKVEVLVLIAAVMAFILVPQMSWAQADKTFAAKCAVCHGADGAGKLKGTPDLRSAEVQKQTDPQLFDIIAKGKGGKATHAFEKKGLDEKAIKELVTYVRGLAKKK